MYFNRFSQDTRIVLSHLNPSQYGDVFTDKARAMIGYVLAVPILETVMGFLLLAPGIGGKGGPVVLTVVWCSSDRCGFRAVDDLWTGNRDEPRHGSTYGKPTKSEFPLIM